MNVNDPCSDWMPFFVLHSKNIIRRNTPYNFRMNGREAEHAGICKMFFEQLVQNVLAAFLQTRE